MRKFLVIALAIASFGLPVTAQETDTLADIRQELSVLFVEIQKLKQELSTTSGPTAPETSGSVLDRVAAIEAELQRLTAQTEDLEHRVNRVVSDGTNRIGDLEFRLVELEGGDVSTLGETTTLGGDGSGGTLTTQPIAPLPVPGAGVEAGSEAGGELAVAEQADFDAAAKALASGNPKQSAELFSRFNQTYPGSPLAAKAQYGLGQSLEQLGDTREAARAYLAAFTTNATGPIAPDALWRLGTSLGRLGQVEQACITLGEVGVRFPMSESVSGAQQEMAALGCS